MHPRGLVSGYQKVFSIITKLKILILVIITTTNNPLPPKQELFSL